MTERMLVNIGGSILRCDIAASPHEQRVGLERYASLAEGDALLFPIRPSRYVTFHAGKVSFPFDVVFVGLDRRVAKIVSDVQPGDSSMWSFGPCAGVIETPGGFCERHAIREGDQVAFDEESVAHIDLWNRFGSLRNGALEGYSADPGATQPGDHGPAGHDRFRDRDPDVTKRNPNAEDDAMPNWHQQIGYDPTVEDHRTENAPSVFRPSAKRDARGRVIRGQGLEGAQLPSGEIVDPVAFATKAIQLISNAARQGDSLVWKKDPLNPVEEYAYVTPATIKSWLDHVGVGNMPSVVDAATSAEGMDVLSETLVLGEVATRTRMSPDGSTLILYRTSPG